MKMEALYVEFAHEGVVTVGTEEVSTEGLEPLEVVVRNEATLVSAGTELARLHNVGGRGGYPARPGYAAVGRILQKGDAVEDFETGERVLYAGKHASVQRFRHGQGHQWGRLYPVPEGIEPPDAVFAWLAEISMSAPCVTSLDLNDTVAVFGLGLIGNLAAQLYRLLGARVVGLDPVSARCELAAKVGVETTIDAGPDQQVEAVIELTEDRGADVTVDAAGHSAVIRNCVEATALFGQVILLGTPRAAYKYNVAETMMEVHEKGLVVRGAHQWRFPAMELREVKQTVPWGFRTMFDLIGSGRLSVTPLRSHLAEPREAPEMYESLREDRRHCWGVVFDWSEAGP